MVLSPANRLKVFQLQLSDPGRSFYSSGDKLSGSVQLEAAQPCRLAGLRVTAAGCAHVQHRGGKNRKNRSQEVEYLKYEEELRLEEQLEKGTALIRVYSHCSLLFIHYLPYDHLCWGMSVKCVFIYLFICSEKIDHIYYIYYSIHD